MKKKKNKKEVNGKPKDLYWVPDNNWGAGHWEDSDGNTWVQQANGLWQNWGRNP